MRIPGSQDLRASPRQGRDFHPFELITRSGRTPESPDRIVTFWIRRISITMVSHGMLCHANHSPAWHYMMSYCSSYYATRMLYYIARIML